MAEKPSETNLESTLVLLERAKAGDEKAENELYTRCLGRLQRWAARRIPARARGVMDTDDLVQDTLLRTLNNVDGFEAEHSGGFHAYVRKIVLNRIRDEVRKVNRRRPADESAGGVADPGPSPLEELIGIEKLERYERALEMLTPMEREAVVARLELSMTYEEIAAELGKPSPDSARMTVSRAVARLASSLASSTQR